MRRAFCIAALIGFSATYAWAGVVPTEERPVALLRALDKVTARVDAVEATVEQPLKFGNLIITVHNCRVTPPEETPEAAAFLDIAELKPGETEQKLFRGWMFASSPALSALEHPIYDLWVTGCKVASVPVTAPSAAAPAPAVPVVPAVNVSAVKK